ncbi:MAG: peptide-methionine (R)-S-oxide reductase MsrB [Polyangiaceae bacterium]|nr:peptide-methionine (R)-S-oxide reductase MsrB [Polyangiaceae bacterium]
MSTSRPDPSRNHEFAKILTPEEYRITREGGTEPAFSGVYNDDKQPGNYHCKCCGEVLFRADEKFDSGSGWPSFFASAPGVQIKEIEDTSYGMRRVEIRCPHCDAHLGHVFPDGPAPTGQRYCVNSLSLKKSAAKTQDR